MCDGGQRAYDGIAQTTPAPGPPFVPFHFVHTADIHLDSPLRSLALRDPDIAELIGDATRQAFGQTIDLCLDERVDALMIAGDLYDGDQTSIKTALFLAEQLRRLDEAGIRTFIVRGNHDAQSRITRELTLPERVKVFGGRGEAVELERPHGEIPVAVHGVSFAKPQAPESLVPKFRHAVADAFNIGLLHTSLGGSPNHDPYAPCSVAELAATGFDYWCLGHIHKREVHSEKPFVVMPGIPQGRHIGEDGPRSVTVVRIGDDRSVSCREHSVCVAQFERVTVDLTGVEERREMAERIGAKVEAAQNGVVADHVVIRLKLHGRTALNWQLRRDPETVEAEARDRASRTGKTWIEKVELETEEPGAYGTGSGPMSEFAPTMRGLDLRSNESFREEARVIMEELSAALPPKARGVLGGNEEERIRILDALIAEGREAVLAHLHRSAGEEGED